ncbi:MAG: hypothetical protein HC927_06730, partial [Deltaproteobacteria bacterium]|nr:hypothetical protein [Deltaproteobacteria bacterium]
AQDERTRQAQATLDRAAASLRQTGQSADRAAAMNQLADQITIYAGRVENATTIDERRAVNALLTGARNTALTELAQSPALRSGLAATILAILDDVIADTTPAYSWEQRAVIEGARLHGHQGPGGALPTVVLDLGNPARASDPAWNGGQRPARVVDLIQESRLLLNHPYENPWWVPVLTDYVNRNQAQILADIEARNLGYATLRRPGERRQGH